MPHSIATAFTKTRAWLNGLDPRIQMAILLLFVAGTLQAISQINNTVQPTLDTLCGPTRAGRERNLYTLAASLRAVFHQRLADKTARMLPLVIPEQGGETIRGNIRNGKFELLASDIQSQERLLAQGKPIPV